MNGSPRRLELEHLDRLIAALVEDGFEVWGPRRSGDALAHGRLEGVADLPAGWTEEQGPGRSRLRRRDDEALFGYGALGTSYKPQLHPPRQTIFRAQSRHRSLRIFEPERPAPPPRAWLGVRSCDLAAVAVLDGVLGKNAPPDPNYVARREGLFVIAVACTEPGQSCFCTSMGTGPRPQAGYDILLVEVLDEEGWALVAEAGSEAGRDRLEGLGAAADSPLRDRARRAVEEAAGRMDKKMEAEGLQDHLPQRPEHPRWDDVAERCLSCGNCTMVCPTCFCTSVEDHLSLDGSEAERTKVWDSCFARDFSYIHGGPIRGSVRARYRQWLTHKLADWHFQFGTSGCVGCGRCVTWCPAGIDITEEVRALREEQ